MHTSIACRKTISACQHCSRILDVRSGDDFLGAVGYQLLRTCEGCFEVKLQADYSFIIDKSLIFTSGAAGYMLGSFRNIEGVAGPESFFAHSKPYYNHGTLTNSFDNLLDLSQRQM